MRHQIPAEAVDKFRFYLVTLGIPVTQGKGPNQAFHFYPDEQGAAVVYYPSNKRPHTCLCTDTREYTRQLFESFNLALGAGL